MAVVKLGDVAVEANSSNKGDKSGCKIVGLEHLKPNNIMLTEWSEDIENTFTKEFTKGDILFGRRRAYLKKAAIAPFDGICSGDITVIRAIDEKISRNLLPFVIQNDFFFDYAVGKSAGSLSPRVKWGHLKEFEFELPEMGVQKKLADALWAINDTRQAYIELIEKTDNLVKSQFIEMFTLSNYPLVSIEKMVDRGLKKKKDIIEMHDTIHYIDISSIDNGSKQVTGYVEYQIDEAPSRAQQVLKKGDILFSTVRPNLQNIAVNPYSEDNVVASTGFCVLRCTECLPEYMWGVILSDDFTRTMCEEASGISYPAVRDSNVLQYKIPNAPIDLQKQFAAFIHQTDKSKFELRKAIAHLDSLSRKIIEDNLIK